MPTESFLDASEEELLKIANLCLERAGSALEVPPQNFDDFVKLRLFLEAQSCLAEVVRKQAERTSERDRKRNEEIARRDFWMEVGVMALIGIEIVLSVFFGFRGLSEGRQQAAILEQMKTSTAATAKAIQQATTSLETLAKAQAESLQIFQKEEADRLAQLAKRRTLVLYIGHVPLAKAHGVFKPSQETDTSATYDIVLRNVGEATANKVIWRALVPLDVNLVSYPTPTPGNDLPDRPVRAFLYFQDLIPPKGYVEVTVTFVFPKGHPPFPVTFNASSPEIIGETPLGVLLIAPRTPSH